MAMPADPPSRSTPKTGTQRNWWPWVIAAGVVAVILIWLSRSGGLTPSPEIVGVSAREGIPNFDYTVYVDCTVRNNGREGNIEVVADLAGGGQWRKRQTVFVDKSSERRVTLAFAEAELFGAGLEGYKYNCSAMPK